MAQVMSDNFSVQNYKQLSS